MTPKQFPYYPGQQQNAVGLSEIASYIYQINLSPSQIDDRAFFVKTLIHSISFLP